MTYIGRTWLYWRNLTSIGRISLLLAEYDLHWQNMVYTGSLSLLLVEFDLYWQNMTSIGRIWFILAYFTLAGRICSQSKVFCRSALLCRCNIPTIWGEGCAPQPSVQPPLPVWLQSLYILRESSCYRSAARFTKYLTIYHKIILSLSYDRLTIVT